MKRFTFSIRNKIILLMIFSITVSSSILGAYFLNRIRLASVPHELAKLEIELEEHKTVLAAEFQALETKLLPLSTNKLVNQVVNNLQTKQNLHTFFEDFLRNNPDYLAIAYIDYDKNKQQQIVKVDRIDDYTIEESKEFSGVAFVYNKAIALTSDKVYLSNIFFNSQGVAAIRIAAQVKGTDSKSAVIFIDYKVQAFLAQTFPEGLSAYITNRNGAYLLNTAKSKQSPPALNHKIQHDFPETTAMFFEGKAVPSKVMAYPTQEHPRYILFSRLYYNTDSDKAYVGLLLLETEDTLLTKADESFKQLLMMILAVIFGCILVSCIFILRLTAPLKELVSASNQLNTDFSTINFPTDSNDELAALARSLETMNRTIIQQNESLKHSELMSRSIMNNMSDALITLTSDGLIHSFNTAAEKLFIYTADEVREESVALLIPELETIKIQTDVELRGVNKNGSDFPLEVSITDMALHYRKTHTKKFFIVLCRNIEARKRAEQQLKRVGQLAIAAKEEAEKANAAKTQFLSRMSHEFRTPLNAVLGFTQVLLMDETPEETESLIQPVYDSGNRLLEMVNNVLDISSMETGEMAFVLETIELISVVKEVHAKALEKVKDSKTEIQLSIKANQPDIFIKADRDRLAQVLLNLLNNAINFNRNNGKIILSVRQLNAETVGISIKDQGIGISKENLNIIFNPFERLNAYDLGVDGIGVGLTIAKQLTEKMGGSIGVESVEEVGSRFFVIFPVCEPDEKYLMMANLNQQNDRITLPTNKATRILYIEDDAINLAFMEKVLAKYENIEFVPANNPVLGINSVRKQPPDLVLLDLHLPDINGFEVFECLKNYPGMEFVPIIAITASKEKKDIDKAMELGFYAYIVKPVKTAELYKTISEALYYKQSATKKIDNTDEHENHSDSDSS